MKTAMPHCGTAVFFIAFFSVHGLLTTPTKSGSPSAPVMANKNGRSNTKSISSSGGAAAPAIIMTVYAAAVTPSSSMATRAAWSALERNISATFEVMGLKSATVASNTPVIPSAFRPSRRSRSETTSNLGNGHIHDQVIAVLPVSIAV